MTLDETQTLVAIASSGAAVLAAAIGWLRWVRPRFRRVRADFVAARDSIVGRDPVMDTITGVERLPALPGIGVRMATTEQQLGVLTDAVAKIADSHVRLENHEERIARLEAASVERVVTKAESAAAWRAVEAVAQASTPPEGVTD